MKLSDHPAAPTADFIRVSAAKRLYFGGAMSLRWWYKQIELGSLPHYRAGGAVLLRPADVEAFIRARFHDRVGEAVAPDPPPEPPPRSGGVRGLRFFKT